MERSELEQWKGREVARLLALVESERRYYQEIVASIPVGLLVLAHDMSVVSSNRAMRRILGVRSSDAVQEALGTIIPADVLEKIQHVFKGFEPATDLIVEHEGRRLRVSAIPIRNGDEDYQFEALVAIEDLTDLTLPAAPAPAAAPEPVRSPAPQPQPAAEPKPAEVAAEPAQAEAIELLQSLNAAIWALDISNKTFLFVTNTAEEVLGFHPDHWLNTPGFWSQRIYTPDREAILKSYDEAIQQGRRHSCEFRAQAADGRLLWLRETARVLSDSDGPKHLIGITIDVTERRQLEDEYVRAERMDALGKLASRLSHDLNNMLMIVKGYGEEVLHSVAKNDPLRSDMQEMLTATDRISALTSQLLAFTRRQAAPAVTVDLSQVMAGLESVLRESAGDHVTLEIQTDPGLQAKADPMQLDELLTSIAARMRSVMSSGKLLFKIGEREIQEDLRRAELVLKPGLYAAISVEDGGEIDRETQMSFFESFLPAKEVPGETLAILSRSYTFVRQWGGDISVESTTTGTRVSVLLPHAGRKDLTKAPEPEAPASTVVEPPTAVEPPASSLETILVVEDEAGIRALIRKILRRQGYNVLEASNGDEALKICHEHTGRINLLITDVIMPNLGGRELVEMLKDSCRGMKVLYVSGYTDDAGIYAQELPPGTAFLQKPFTLGSLLDKVKDVLSQ